MRLFFFIGIVFLVGCSSSRKSTSKVSSTEIKEFRLISQYIYPNAVQFKNTTIGGLSGIDYDAKRNVYYMICDDPSAKGPTRYYTARIPFSEKGIDSVQIIEVTALLNRKGEPYVDINKDRIHSADVEAMRYDSKRDELIWSSEGQRNLRDGKKELQNPEIVIMDREGRYKDSFALPFNMHIQLEEKGPRHNSVFEGIAFDEDNRHVYISVEEPIYEDGPRAGGGDSTAWIRILKFNRQIKQCVAQYAYQVDPVPYPANPPGAFKVNGVSDILYLGNEKFIVTERGYSNGRLPSDVRFYIANAKGAEDISNQSLQSHPVKKPITKKLLLDLNSLGIFIDNIEGVTFGPTLSNGHRTLLCVADDNFSKNQKSQFLLFEIIP